MFRNSLVCLMATAATATSAVLNSPSQTAVNAAVNCSLISYGRGFSGGAYTNGAWFGGASITLATASYAGNTSADARLLQQIRHSIAGGKEICANGGYPAQHELHATGMFAIARHTPRIWDQLSTSEKTRIDLVMKAGFIASAFTTSDNNPYILAKTQEYSLDGDSNLSRGWNPNYREGMIGGVLVGMVYFGGPTPATTILSGYNHSQFVSALFNAGLTNAAATFNWKAANPSSPAPSGTMIENAVKNYKFFNSTLASYNSIYLSLLNDTYGKNVNAGLNGGAGISGAGKIYSGAAGLPNPGAAGMLKEFDSFDGGGARSAMSYAYDGFRPHLTNQIALVVGGYLQKGSATAVAAATKMNIGNTDFYYKVQKGYIDYAKGKSQGLHDEAWILQRGFTYVRSHWEDVLMPFHFSEAPLPPAGVDSNGDGTDDRTKVRLGLDIYDGSSRFTLVRSSGGVLDWPSKSGLTFIVQRSSSLQSSWTTIATIAGTSDTASFTDPSPPAGRAFYRVGLLP